MTAKWTVITLMVLAGLVLKAADQGPARMRAYIIVSLLTGARTEEMRALRWHDVDVIGQLDADPPVPPNMALVRSVRAGGDTKTRKSRRALILPQRAVDALEVLWEKRTCAHAEMPRCSCLGLNIQPLRGYFRQP
jgi:integrase